MPPRNNQQETSDRIPADSGKQIFNEIENYSKHENFRRRVKEIFDDYTDSVAFMDKVKGYAGREIDERIFKNGLAITVWILSLIVAAVLGSLATKYIH